MSNLFTKPYFEVNISLHLNIYTSEVHCVMLDFPISVTSSGPKVTRNWCNSSCNTITKLNSDIRQFI